MQEYAEGLPGFAERLKQCREKAGLSQKDLADAISVTPQAIWNYENREGGISAEKLFPLADRLGVSARWLACGVDDGVALPIPGQAHPAIAESAACLDAFLANDGQSVNLVKAALSLLKAALK
jgi:transcriptional regulator with XRE-family HTH domain